MKILVTGSTGFIGNHVIQRLLKEDVDIVASSSREEHARSFPWFKDVTYIPYDLNETTGDCFQVFQKPDAVIHLAWQGLPNYKDLFHIEENLWSSYSFLKNMIESGVRNVAVTGTCFEYGMQTGCLSEDTCAQPSNPYGVAKDALRRFLFELQKTGCFSLKWIRLFYMYGPGQNPRSLIAQLDTALENNEPVFNMSGGEQIRDFLPIEKVADNIVKIALQNTIDGIINCCSGTPVTVKDFVLNYLDERQKFIALNLGHYGYPDYEPMEFWGDNRKLKRIEKLYEG